MADALKNIYSKSFFEVFSSLLESEIPNFNKNKFQQEIFIPGWENLELKQRMTHIASVLKNHFHKDYQIALNQICQLIDKQKRDHSNGFNFEFMFFPEFIQLYGLSEYQTSIKAIEKVTQYTSCEFVVRHFLNAYPEKMSKQMFEWANHKNHYVRRLASEGMRTKLPWAIKVNHLSANPEKILPLLENLIEDESDWVRKSVANSLNDLSKDIPDLVLNFAKKWINSSEKTNKVLKHGLRTLLKQGNIKALELFGLNPEANILLKDFSLLTKNVKLGDYLEFEYEIENLETHEVSVRLEYRIYFLRENGTLYPKTFKISEKILRYKENLRNAKKHSFKLITTRKFHLGEQKISFVVNGKELIVEDFSLCS
jgi:3-methyladenine DNA glycosylase AlkC